MLRANLAGIAILEKWISAPSTEVDRHSSSCTEADACFPQTCLPGEVGTGCVAIAHTDRGDEFLSALA